MEIRSNHSIAAIPSNAELQVIVRAHPASDVVVPREAGKVLYRESTGLFAVGVWQGERGDLPINDYPVHEFCHLHSGSVTLMTSDGSQQSFTAGDSFVVPMGFCGLWRTNSTTRKTFACYGSEEGLTALLGPQPAT